MVKALIDPKKSAKVRDALKRGHFEKILVAKKPVPAVEPANAGALPKSKGTLNAIFLDAAREGNAGEAKRLLNAGADVNSFDADKWTALMYAAKYGYAELAKMLIDAKANVNCRNKSRETPLIIASAYDYIEIVRIFIEAKTNLSAKAIDGYTALCYAQLNRNWEMAKLLEKHGATL